MKVWVYVEGQSDRRALEALWGEWKKNLRRSGWGVRIIPLENKPKFFKNIGLRVVQRLMDDSSDYAIGLPDLYPNREYADTVHKHGNLDELSDVQTRLVSQELKDWGLRGVDVESHMDRFYAAAFKHDMEVLLLAAASQLQSRLKMSNKPHGWRNPPEEQNQDNPPKIVVQDLFRRHRKKSYRENVDSPAILRDANLEHVAKQCPAFRAMIDWIGEKTGVPAY